MNAHTTDEPDLSGERVMVEAACEFARTHLPSHWTPSPADMARLLTHALRAKREHEEAKR